MSIAIILLCLSDLTAQNSITATRISEEITLDGVLNESVWESAEIATDFTTWSPEAGLTPKNKTEVKIIYDDNAIYFGATLHTESREEIKTELTERDDIGNTDWFGMIIDTYGNGTEGAEFIITATGGQFDAKVSSANGEDSDWDEIWYGEVHLTDKGWFAEVKIPYSALRFPKTEEQKWRVNLMRRMADSGQRCSFEFINPEISGFVNQTAFLNGISNIKSPLRLGLYPYVSGYVENFSDPSVSDGSSVGLSYNGGMDLKYGINESFTLDMTLIPDFGQVRSDDRVLNLSPFEQRFNENRAFFTEGIELFSRANIFYTRRVGGTPMGFWDVEDELEEGESIRNNPGETRLYNATKISGRTSGGLGVGVFNAVSAATYAEIENDENNEIRRIQTAPLTNYNVTVFDKNLPNNSFISLINTNVTRQGDDYYNANVTGTEFEFKTKELKWGVDGFAAFSQIINPDADNQTGIDFNLEFGKISGKHTYWIETSGTSQDFDNNDLGFNTRTNLRDHQTGWNYNNNEGWKSFSQIGLWFNVWNRTTYDTNEFMYLNFNTGFWTQTKKQWNFNMWTNYSPESHDYFEPRQAGSFMKRPSTYNMGWWAGTDSRKKFWLGAFVFGQKNFEPGAGNFEWQLEPRYRFSDKFSLSLAFGADDYKGLRGWVDEVDDLPIMSKRDQLTVSNILSTSYTFNEKMSINFRARHYWSRVLYTDYFSLEDDGSLGLTNYDVDNDFTFSLFNIDCEYRWRFAPGSDIIIVWKNSISGDEVNNSTLNIEDRNYWNGLSNLNQYAELNSLSIKVVYFINGQNLFR